MKILRIYNIIAFRLDWVSKFIAFLLLVGVFLCIMLQVFFNYVLSSALSWTQELSRLMLVWLTFFGAAVVTRRSLHIGLGTIVGLFPERIQNVVRIIGYGLAIFFIQSLITFGWKISLFGRGQTLNYLDISYFWGYVGIPIGSALILIQVIYLMMNEGLSFFGKGDAMKEFEPEKYQILE